MDPLIKAIHCLTAYNDSQQLLEQACLKLRSVFAADGVNLLIQQPGGQLESIAEDAIQPLYKLISNNQVGSAGAWVITQNKSMLVDDMRLDERVDSELYQNSFVKSAALVPVEIEQGLLVVALYWAEPFRMQDDDFQNLQVFASTVGHLYKQALTAEAQQLQLKFAEKRLDAATQALESFSYSISHDFRAPLRHIDGFVKLLEKDAKQDLSVKGKHFLSRLQAADQRIFELVDDLLLFSRVVRHKIQPQNVDLGQLAQAAFDELKKNQPEREVHLQLSDNLKVKGDLELLQKLIEQLMANAWKYTRDTPAACIALTSEHTEDGQHFFRIKDNGVGFNMDYAGKIFGIFQKLHLDQDFEGHGLGLALAERIVINHGGEIWVEGQENQGASVFFTLPEIYL